MPQNDQDSGSEEKSFLDYALSYASRGLEVFPVMPGAKFTLKDSSGCNDATVDPKKVRAWWTNNPNANIACNPGKSGFTVLDLDTHDPEKNGVEMWEKADLALPGLVVTTPSGGRHLWFKGARKAKAYEGVDIKSKGGYVLMPPSRTAEGTYEFSRQEPIGPLTPEYRDWIKTLTPIKKAVLAAVEGTRSDVLVPVGGRHAAIAQYAGSLHFRGILEEEALLLCKGFRDTKCEPGGRTIPDKEIEDALSYTYDEDRTRERALGSRVSAERAEIIETLTPRCPDPKFAAMITTVLDGSFFDAKMSVGTRRDLAARALMWWFQDNGFFLRTMEGPKLSSLLYFLRSQRQLFRLDSIDWLAMLSWISGTNAASPHFAHLKAACESHAVGAEVRPVYKVSYWDGEVLRVSNFNGSVYVLDGESITVEENGAKALFEDHPLWEPYDPDYDSPGAAAWLSEELPNWKESSKEASALAFRIWQLSTFFTECIPARPHLLFLAEKGTGKTVAPRMLLRSLFGAGVDVIAMPENARSFKVVVSNRHLIVLDNVDKYSSWAQDVIAGASTGQSFEDRTLYRDSEVSSSSATAWMIFTARTPDTLRRDDIVERLIPLELEPIKKPGDEEPYVSEGYFRELVVEKRGAFWGETLTELNAAVARIRAGEMSKKSSNRLVDWCAFGALVAKNRGKEEAWRLFLNQLSPTQLELLADGEIIVDAVGYWLDKESNRGRQMLARDLYYELMGAMEFSWGGKPPSDWPTSTRSFGIRLRALKDALRMYYKIDITTRKGNPDYWAFSPREEATGPLFKGKEVRVGKEAAPEARKET